MKCNKHISGGLIFYPPNSKTQYRCHGFGLVTFHLSHSLCTIFIMPYLTCRSVQFRLRFTSASIFILGLTLLTFHMGVFGYVTPQILVMYWGFPMQERVFMSCVTPVSCTIHIYQSSPSLSETFLPHENLVYSSLLQVK